MKIPWEKGLSARTISNCITIMVGILFFFLLHKLPDLWSGVSRVLDILMPFFYGFAVAYILAYPLRAIENKWLGWMDRFGKRKLKRFLAIFIVMGIAIFLILLLIYIVIPQMMTNLLTIFNNAPHYLSVIESTIVQVAQHFDLDPQVMQSSLVSWTNLANEVQSFISTSVPYIVNTSINLTSYLLDVAVSFIIAVYMLASKEKFMAQIKKLLYAFVPSHYVRRIVDITMQCHTTFIDFLGGKLIDSLIIGVICCICMYLFGMPFPLLVSFIICVTNIIPFFGPFIGAVPTALIIFISAPEKTIWFLLFILVLQQFDGNILGPKILGNSTGLSAFWVIFAILIGGGLFGFLGMLLGVPIFAVIYSLVRTFVENKLMQKGLSHSTKDYASPDNPVKF